MRITEKTSMTQASGNPLRHVIFLRWFARIIGSLFFLLMTVLFIADGMPIFLFATDPFHMTAMSITLLGFLVGWKWDGLAAGLILTGVVADWIIVSIQFGEIMSNMGPIFSFFPLVGFIYLYCWWRSRKTLSV